MVGIYKGEVEEEFITSNTFTYFQEIGEQQSSQAEDEKKIFKSNAKPTTKVTKKSTATEKYHFIDTLAIIQDVAFKLEETPVPKLHWWNKFGIWLSKLKRG